METSVNKIKSSLLPDIYDNLEQVKLEIEFYNDEIKFFRNLLDKYLLPLIDEASISKIQETGKQLTELEKYNQAFSKSFSELLIKMKANIQDSQDSNEKDLKDLYQSLTRERENHMYSFRTFKKNFFSVMEHLFQTEKMQNLLKSDYDRKN